MKNKLTTICLLIITINSCHYSKDFVRYHKVTYHDDRGDSAFFCKKGFENYEKITFKKDSIMHGRYALYDSIGCLLVRGRYKNGKKRGLWEYYERGCLANSKYYTKSDTIILIINNLVFDDF